MLCTITTMYAHTTRGYAPCCAPDTRCVVLAAYDIHSPRKPKKKKTSLRCDTRSREYSKKKNTHTYIPVGILYFSPRNRLAIYNSTSSALQSSSCTYGEGTHMASLLCPPRPPVPPSRFVFCGALASTRHHPSHSAVYAIEINFAWGEEGGIPTPQGTERRHCCIPNTSATPPALGKQGGIPSGRETPA